MTRAAHGVEIVRAMSREDFHKKFVKGIGKTRAFGAIASLGPDRISPEQKTEVRKALDAIGIPLSMTASDNDLCDIVAEISARAVALR